MSSTAHTSIAPNVLEYNKAAKQLIHEKNYQEAITILDKTLEEDPSNLETYLLRSQCAHGQTNFEQALQYLNKGLGNTAEDPDNEKTTSILKLRLLNLRSQIHKELKNFEASQTDAEQVKNILQRNGQNGKLSQLLSLDLQNGMQSNSGETSMNREYFSAREEGDTTEKEHEVQAISELFQQSMNKNLLSTEFNIVYLVSMKWFERWKRYTNFNFDILRKPGESYTDKNVNDSGEGLLREDNEIVNPGPIDADDIIDQKTKFLTDPDLVKEYCNVTIKQGLTENKEFIILPHPVYKYLQNIYGGQGVKRYVVSLNDESNQTSIELWLKKINFLVCPSLRKQEAVKCEIQSLFISKKETIKDLREKVTRIYKIKGHLNPKAILSSCRLWKLDPREDHEEFFKSSEAASGLFPIKGKKLPDGLVLEEAELGDTDIVICEYKMNNSWRFLTEDDYFQLSLTKCGYCGSKSDNLAFCECKTIKYCDGVCQRNHRGQHKDKCVQVKTVISKNNEIMRQFKLSKTKFTTSSRYGMCGLQNLGNTCFMNSSLQCMSHITELTYYFLENNFIKDLNKHNRLGTGGRLAAAYAELMKELWHGSDNYVSPWDIKKIISDVASQFSGYNQQDAQEFLAYLVDGLHEDLDKIMNKPYVETVDSDDRPDEIVAKQSWDNHIKRNQSIIVDLMHGQYKSKLVCPDCKKISITFDPFMTISLPIPATSMVNFPIYLIHKNDKNFPDKINLTIDPTAPCLTIIDKVAELVPIPKEALELCLLREQNIVDVKLQKVDVKTLKDDQGMVFIYQTHNPELDGPLEDFIEEEKIKIEIQMFIDGEEIEQLSFSRLLYVSKGASLRDLHLQIYYLMRCYLASVFPPERRDRDSFWIDLEKSDLESIQQEYQAFSQEFNLQRSVYEIIYARELNNKKVFLPPIQSVDDKTLKEFFGNVNSLILNLVLNKDINSDQIKLNKCHEFQGPVPKDKKAFTLSDCFDLFTKPEILDEDNLWYCNKCKEHKQATKKMDIFKLPKVLILHLKRFKTSRVHSIGSYFFSGGSSKIGTLIDFPIENLDLRKYNLGTWEEPPIYDLFAVTNHYGSLGGGHYTAYAKNPVKNQWFDFNDSSVSRQDQDEIATAAAYLLFYRRREVEK